MGGELAHAGRKLRVRIDEARGHVRDRHRDEMHRGMHVDPGRVLLPGGQIRPFWGPAKLLSPLRRHGTLPCKRRAGWKMPQARERVCKAVSQTGTTAADAAAPPTRSSQAPGAMLGYG
jgi:hypothetical protein